MTFELPNLPYSYEALEPYMSRETLEFHHDKHHLAYVNNGNKFLKDSDLKGKKLEDIVIHSYQKNPSLFNNAAQHYNHLHFWKMMKKSEEKKNLPSELDQIFSRDLGGYDKVKADFTEAALGQFGSGWAWIAVKDKKLKIMKTPNGENPLIHGAKPILGIDVWEHSYYIDYRNDRQKYVNAFLDHLVNWDYVLELYNQA